MSRTSSRPTPGRLSSVTEQTSPAEKTSPAEERSQGFPARITDVWAGTVVYEQALAWQRRVVAARAQDVIGDALLTLEHDRVYTAGRHADVATNVLGTRDIRVVRIDRGGDVTYHGPGQLVAYPITRLRSSKAVRPFVCALQEACVRTAADYGVAAGPSPRGPGVWVGDAKLAAVGVRINGHVTSHGLAFNVTTDLDDFAGLIPCGLVGADVCSLQSLGVSTTVEEVRPRLARHLADALGLRLDPSAAAAVLDLLPHPAAGEGAADPSVDSLSPALSKGSQP